MVRKRNGVKSPFLFCIHCGYSFLKPHRCPICTLSDSSEEFNSLLYNFKCSLRLFLQQNEKNCISVSLLTLIRHPCSPLIFFYRAKKAVKMPDNHFVWYCLARNGDGNAIELQEDAEARYDS